jgi:hypothetical protein
MLPQEKFRSGLPPLLFLVLLATPSISYAFDVQHGIAKRDLDLLTAANIQARNLSTRQALAQPVAITNVRIFDGTGLSPPRTVITNGTYIKNICSCKSHCPPVNVTYDGCGRTLLPGLIDSHAHPSGDSELTNMTRNGVTTTIIAHCQSSAHCASLTNHPGLTHAVLGSFAATTPNSTNGQFIGPTTRS